MSRQLATAQCAQRWKLGGQAFHEAQVLPCRSLSSPLSSDCGLLLLFTQSCLTVCDPMDCSMPGFPDLHRLPEPAQTHVHWSVTPGESGLVSSGSQGLRSPLESRRGSLGAP